MSDRIILFEILVIVWNLSMTFHSSSTRGDEVERSDIRLIATQRKFYIDILKSLIKSFPGSREDAIGKVIKYL